jgi:hypothetical protein
LSLPRPNRILTKDIKEHPMEYSPLIFAETDEGVRLVRSILPDDLDVQVLKGGDMSASIHYASSCALAKPRTAVVIIETASEEDRFYKDWLRDALSVMPIRADSQLHVIGAAPSLSDAVEDPDWVARVLSAVTSEPDHQSRMGR